MAIPGKGRDPRPNFRAFDEARALDHFMAEEDIDVAVAGLEAALEEVYSRRPRAVAPHSDQEWDGPIPPRKPADARASAVPHGPGRPETY